ncbi:DUF882 domain-containing protein [Ancylobacter terrae]|uniref:DUF882 domain-containing protein n=1 Tax=Ancylobacter sp. sgz301288 TaxID=3342077 RepID=UPI00385E5DB9
MHSKQKYRSYFLLKATALAAIATLCGTTMLQDAIANGDTRTISLHHVHSGESGTITFKRDGRYDPAALQRLNVLLQDWRRKEPTKMDPYLFDIIWEVYRDTGATAPIEVIGGYRSPATNAMLRARSKGVAQTSQHMLGKAMDFYIPGVPLAKIREAGLRLQRGGVGFYPTSGSPFVHLDTGGIRHWPRMTRDQLARVFPDGKTVHIPADGKPMPGYQAALAMVEERGNRPGGAGAAFASASPGKPAKNIFASLFGKKNEAMAEDEEDAGPAPAAAPVVAAATTPAAPPAGPAAVAAASSVVAAASVPLPAPRAGSGAPVAAPAAPVLAAADVPLPPVRPGAAPAAAPALQVAAAAVPLPLARPASAAPAPAEVATAAFVEPEAPLAAAPLAPAPVPPARPALVAALKAGDDPTIPATVPLPRAKTNATVGEQAETRGSAIADAGPSADLPPLILHGSNEPQRPMLSYASAGDFVVARPAIGKAPQPAAVPIPERPATARPPHPAEVREEIRRLFTGPSVAASPTLRAPEMRRLAAFVAPPKQVIDGGFGRDASGGLDSTRFSGAAVIAVPVVTLASADGPAPKKRLSMVQE